MPSSMFRRGQAVCGKGSRRVWCQVACGKGSEEVQATCGTKGSEEGQVSSSVWYSLMPSPNFHAESGSGQ